MKNAASQDNKLRIVGKKVQAIEQNPPAGRKYAECILHNAPANRRVSLYYHRAIPITTAIHKLGKRQETRKHEDDKPKNAWRRHRNGHECFSAKLVNCCNSHARIIENHIAVNMFIFSPLTMRPV